MTPTTILPPAHVGGTVLLPAADANPSAQVTLTTVIDPAQAVDQSIPVPGDRFVGVQLRIAFGRASSVSSVASNLTGDIILDDDQGILNAPIDTNIANCPALNLRATVSPGATLFGCVTFELGTNTKISEITFTPSGQFGNVSAEWQVP